MNRESVNSSNLRSAGYETDILKIEFKSGAVYQYRDVPERVYRGLMLTSSKGTYFNDHIKDIYPYSKIG